MKKIIKAFAFIAWIIPQGAFSQKDARPAFVKDSLDTYVARALKEWPIPGVAVGIVKDGKVVLLKGYGVKVMGGNDKVDENTLFMIGSNTKAMTATALALLDAQKKLSLDDKVVKWLPEFKMEDPWVTKELMIRDLLCHRLGMETFQGDFMYWTSDLTDKQVMEKFGKLTPMYSFRSRWGYTNAAFLTAGEIIPKVTGKSWAEFLTENIFRPLGMNNTLALSKDLANAPNKAAPHTYTNDYEMIRIPYCKIDNLAPAGAVSSSVSDMSKWVMMLLNNGKLNGKDIIPSAAIAQTRTPHSILGNGGTQFNSGHFALYGLGWFLEEYAGKKVVSHTGGVNGFVTSVTLVPEEKLGILVFTNTDQNNFYESLKLEILDAYLRLPYRNYSKIQLQGTVQQEKFVKNIWKLKFDTVAMHIKTSLPLSAYAGQYENNIYGQLNIREEKDKLIMSFEHHPNLIGTMEALGGDRFVCTYSDPVFGRKVIPFQTEGGKVISMTLRVADFVEFTTYQFLKKP